MAGSKLNYRFHVTATPEKLVKELHLVCVEANKKKVEDGLKDESSFPRTRAVQMNRLKYGGKMNIAAYCRGLADK